MLGRWGCGYADTRAAASGACEPSIKNIALSRGVHVLLLCAGMRLWPGQCCLGQNGPMKGSVVKSSVVLGVVTAVWQSVPAG